ncbi:MAG: hypothetical protein C5B54_09075 [Acidobacteria bacterium]|nr:MAG: hypothetical protein C5B54_09075 [Acidobacteriota bacterium]
MVAYSCLLFVAFAGTISFKDVSVSSGIEVNTIATKAVQWIDYNRDGKLDLVLLGDNGTALFKNIGNGKFVDVTQQAHFGNGGRFATGASWADIDNNGFPDVFISNHNDPPKLLLNQNGVFKDITSRIKRPSEIQSSGPSVGGIFIDINNDKLIDLYIINEGAPNQLFKHTGATQFTDISSSAHLNYNGPGRSAVAADFNGDGYQDLYLVNVKAPNKLYLNNKDGTFTDIATAAGVDYNGATVSTAAADINHDQKPDLLVVDNENSSFLYKNLGNLKFQKVIPGPLKSAKHGVAGAFADYDLDTNVDLVLAQEKGAPNLLLRNTGNGGFIRVTGVDLSRPDDPGGICIGDFNNDGLPDIMIGNGIPGQNGGDSLYENTGGGTNNYLALVLEGSSSNRSGIGATVLIQTGQIYQQQSVSGGNGQSQNSLPLNFGLGSSSIVDTVRIVWPDGKTQSLNQVNVNQILKVKEP